MHKFRVANVFRYGSALNLILASLKMSIADIIFPKGVIFSINQGKTSFFMSDHEFKKYFANWRLSS